jgi:hypothetical protein
MSVAFASAAPTTVVVTTIGEGLVVVIPFPRPEGFVPQHRTPPPLRPQEKPLPEATLVNPVTSVPCASVIAVKIGPGEYAQTEPSERRTVCIP